MHRYTKLLLASLTATALLAIAVSSADANRLSLSNQNIRVTWTSLELTNTVDSNTVLCPITMEGSFHSATLSKVIGALIGYITRATLTNPCTGGTATIHTTSLPWHVTYEGFTGTLPRIATLKVLLVNPEFEIHDNTSNLTCTARVNAEHPAQGILNLNTTTGQVESLTAETGKRIPLEGGFCGLGSGIFGGTSNRPTVLGTTTALTVRLI